MTGSSFIDPRFDLNPTLPGLPDPYPIYRAVREVDPVHWCAGANLWAIMRHADAESVLKDPRFSREAYLDGLEARTGPQPIIKMQRHELVFIDNPRHGQLRHVIGEAINAQSVRELQASIDAVVEEKLAPLLSREEFDLINDFLILLPTMVASIWLGVPEADRDRIAPYIFPLVSGRGVARDAATTAAANHAANELHEYFDGLMQQRRRAPTGDLISGLLAAQQQDPSLVTDDVLFALIVAVFAGGHAPGIGLMAGTILALLDFPEQLAALQADPKLLPALVEEALRYTTPTQRPIR